MHSLTAPSAWIERFAHLIAPHGTVLDLACGRGRHALWLQQRGHSVTAVDRDEAALAALQADVTAEAPLQIITADIENAPWPLPGQQFSAVVVTNYLWRPLWPKILTSVTPGGLLLYETFSQGNEVFGKPSNPAFLLHPGELLEICAGWHVVAYECGQANAPQRVVQRIAAIRPGSSATGEAPLL